MGTTTHHRRLARDPSAPTDETLATDPPSRKTSVRGQMLRPRVVLPIAAVIAAVVLAMHRVATLDAGLIWSDLRGAEFRFVALACVVFAASFLVRAARWRVLLGNVLVPVDEDPPSLHRLTRILLVGWLVNCATIARLGEGYRGYRLKREAGIPFATTLGTILTERLVDLIGLAALLIAAAPVAFHGALPATAERLVALGLALPLVGVVGLRNLRRLRPLVAAVLPARARPHYGRLEAGIVGSFRRIPSLLALTTAGWIGECGACFLVARAVGTPLAPAAAATVALVAALLTTVPVTPAGLGIADAGMVVTMTRLGLDPNAAAAVALLVRLVPYCGALLVGLVLAAPGLVGKGRRIARVRPVVAISPSEDRR
jgi:glycosyltransferase 2 family protein